MRFTVINENELVKYSSIQNKNQILRELVSGIVRLNISENSQASTCGAVLF